MVKTPHIFLVSTLAIAAFLTLEKPAMANAPIVWGLNLTHQTLFIHVATRGIVLAIIILIEALLIARICQIAMRKALLAAFVLNVTSAIGGVVLGGAIFSSSCGLPLIIAFPVVGILLLLRLKAPAWFPIITFAVPVIALVSLAVLDARIGIQIPIQQWSALYTPLFIGFGVTMIIEGIAALLFLSNDSRWKAVLAANIASYVFLAAMVPFFAPNPYFNRYPMEFFGRNPYVKSVDSIPEILGIIHQTRASNLELLGLVSDSPPPENYDASFELRILKHMYLQPFYAAEPVVCVAIIEDTLAVSTLTPNAREKLKWFREHMEHWTDVRNAISENDQEAFDATYYKWLKWAISSNPYKDDRAWDDVLDPWKACTELIVAEKSSITVRK